MTAAERPRCLPIPGNHVIRQRDRLSQHNTHAIPAVEMNRIVDQPVRSPARIGKQDSVSSISVNQSVGNQGFRIAQRDRNSSGRTKRASVANDAAMLNVNRPILIRPT
jgi:hypothetical protein